MQIGPANSAMGYHDIDISLFPCYRYESLHMSLAQTAARSYFFLQTFRQELASPGRRSRFSPFTFEFVAISFFFLIFLDIYIRIAKGILENPSEFGDVEITKKKSASRNTQIVDVMQKCGWRGMGVRFDTLVRLY